MKALKRGYEIWKDLPTWAKGVLAIGGTAAIYFAGAGIIKKVKSQADLLKEKKTLSAINGDLKSLEKQGVKKTFTESQYKTFADQIEKQFSGCDWNQNVFSSLPIIGGGWSGSGAMLYNLLSQFKNDADFLSLQQAYDIRKYDQCGTWPFSGEFNGTLNQAVTDELDETEIFNINKMLTSKKIKFLF